MQKTTLSPSIAHPILDRDKPKRAHSGKLVHRSSVASPSGRLWDLRKVVARLQIVKTGRKFTSMAGMNTIIVTIGSYEHRRVIYALL